MLFTPEQVAEIILTLTNDFVMYDEEEKAAKIKQMTEYITGLYEEELEGSFISVVSENGLYKIPFGNTEREKEEFFKTAVSIITDPLHTEEVALMCLDGKEWYLRDLSERGICTFIRKDGKISYTIGIGFTTILQT